MNTLKGLLTIALFWLGGLVAVHLAGFLAKLYWTVFLAGWRVM